MSRQANQLLRVGICRSDCGHQTNSPFHAISKVSKIVHISAVLRVEVDTGIGDTNHHDSILEAS